MAEFYIGTSGWVYSHWEEVFYPENLRAKDKLKYFSQHLKTVEVIPGKKDKKISWSVRGEEIGNYFIPARVSGLLKEDLISAEAGTMVEVIKPLPRRRNLEWFQNFLESVQDWLSF